MQPKVEEVVHRSRRDPRAEPDDVPAESGPSSNADGASPSSARPAPLSARPAPEPTVPAAPAPAAVEPAGDEVRRFQEIEPLVAAGAWDELAERLGPPEDAAKLPPTLGLIYALARCESGREVNQHGANQLAIKCVASMLGVASDSAAAVVVAKRLLRKPPAAWRARPAPRAKVSILIMVVALALGAGSGWYLSTTSVRLPIPIPGLQR